MVSMLSDFIIVDPRPIKPRCSCSRNPKRHVIALTAAPDFSYFQDSRFILKQPPDGALIQAPQLGQFLRREVTLEGVQLRVLDWAR
jgi:hypothetical protein